MKNQERVPFKLGQRVKQSSQYPDKWKIIEDDILPIDKPIIVCLGGNGVVSNTFANGMAKLVENMLNDNKKENLVDIYSLRYGGNVGEITGNILSSEIEELAYKIFLYRLVDEKGHRLSNTQAEMNMRNLNFFTHCFGAKVLDNLFNYVSNCMEQLKYSDEEIKSILGQVLHISYAPTQSNFNYGQNIFIKSLCDKTYDFNDEYKQNYSQKVDFNFAKAFIKDSNINIFVKRLSENENGDDHPITILKADTNNEKEKNRVQVIRKIISNILSYGINNFQEKNNSINGDKLNQLLLINLINWEIKNANKEIGKEKHNENDYCI